MNKKNIMIFMLFLVVSFVLTGCSNDVKVSHELENETAEVEQQQETIKGDSEEEEKVESADDIDEIGEVVNLEEINNLTTTIVYDGKNFTLNIPEIQWVTKGDLELRERAVLNDRENNIATAVGTVRNKGNTKESVIVIVRLYDKIVIDGTSYHVLEVEGRKVINVPANSDVDFKFEIEYDNKEWLGYGYSFE